MLKTTLHNVAHDRIGGHFVQNCHVNMMMLDPSNGALNERNQSDVDRYPPMDDEKLVFLCVTFVFL